MGEISVTKSIVVNAGREDVWELLVDVEGWPEWKPFIKRAKIKGGYESLSCGSRIKMGVLMSGPASVPLTVTVTEFNRPGRLAWEGGVAGLLHAVHSFTLEETADGTRVTSSEVFKGALVGPMKRIFITEEDLEKLHQDWVQAIKDRAEKREDAPAEKAAAH